MGQRGVGVNNGDRLHQLRVLLERMGWPQELRQARRLIEAEKRRRREHETAQVPRVDRRKAPIPRYRHPYLPDLTWSGRGRRPRWVDEWLNAGGRLSQLRTESAASNPKAEGRDADPEIGSSK